MSVTESRDVGEGQLQETDVQVRDQKFNKFYEGVDFLEILESFRSLCSEIGLDPNQYEGFYTALKKDLTFWKASALWQLLDARCSLPVYEGQKACEGKRVLVIGAGPVGLRSAIEAALLGAKVDLVEKRTSFSRNNSLHLWPFLITDLRNLGAKKFYGKFASGTIDHICIRILQSILLKVCLLLGVKVHRGVTFTGLVEPKSANGGWTVSTNPTSCPVTAYHFDVIMAADGKKNSLPGFRLKEFRARLALAITVNFVNRNTKQESSVPEISGVAYVYKQDFFKSLASTHGIELENIVYYKDETHYFVMTATKNSLLKKGVLKKDISDAEQLLAKGNIDQKALERYAIEAVAYSTEGALVDVEFEKNHRGENDVALFDFTSLFAAENAARIVERKGKRILLCVAGDTLIEPFWPTGSGCARGFLGAFDNSWMMKRFVAGIDPVDLIEEREAILYLLPQTTPERLAKNFGGYTIDPKTRYLNLSELVPPGDVTHLYDTDNKNVIKNRSEAPPSSQEVKKATTQAPQRRSVPSTEDVKPKRSKSTEGLASKAQSAESPFEPPSDSTSKLTMPSTEDSSRTQQGVKEFWQKRQSTKSSSQTASKLSSTAQSSTAAKPPLPSSAQSHQKKQSPQTTSDKPVKSSPRGSPQPPPKTKNQTAASPKLWQKKPFSLAKSASPEPVKKSSKRETSTTSQSPKRSPKWARFGNKGRSKSESPEREPKKEKGTVGHPLEVATSLRSLDRESESSMKETELQQQQNVLDIIKQYNKKDEDVKGKHKPSEVAAESPKSVKGNKKKGDSKASKPEKEKHKEKHSKAEKKEPSPSHKGWNPFSFLKKKSYTVSEGGDAHTSKRKKSKKDSSKQAEGKPTAEETLTVQGRIKQLMEHGVATDGSEDLDSSEVVLLSVSPHKEEMSQEAGSDNSSPQEDPDSLQPDVNVGEDVVKSKLEGSPCDSEEEEGEEAAALDTTTDRVKKLQSMFQKSLAESTGTAFSRSLSVNTGRKRSKEIDLSEVLTREPKEKTSHPLWLARVIQALNKCLERLRKENDTMVAKTALEIMNTIFNNVQSFPDSDVYRRVRISSEQFHDHIWQFNNARQFLARSGWVEIDDFIVLPIDSKIDIPKRVLDKHLDIVNQMLWSQQLELPDSPAVVKRVTKVRDRSLSLMRRESYATRIVEESLLKVEEDKMAMAAAKMKRKSSNSSGVRVASPSTLETLSEGNDESNDGQEDQTFVHLLKHENRIEEVQTMKAASAARNIWVQKESTREREYRLNLETELYDLPPQKVIEVQENVVPPATEATSTNTPPSAVQEGTVDTSTGESDRELASSRSSGEGIEDRLRKLTPSITPVSVTSSSTSPDLKLDETAGEDLLKVSDESCVEEKPQGNVSPTTQTDVLTTPTKKLSESNNSDQLRRLLMSSPIQPGKNDVHTVSTGSDSPDGEHTGGSSEKASTSPSEEPLRTADVQYSTTTSIKTGLHEYERLAMEAAAQTRQIWKDTEAASSVPEQQPSASKNTERPPTGIENKQKESEESPAATTL